MYLTLLYIAFWKTSIRSTFEQRTDPLAIKSYKKFNIKRFKWMYEWKASPLLHGGQLYPAVESGIIAADEVGAVLSCKITSKPKINDILEENKVLRIIFPCSRPNTNWIAWRVSTVGVPLVLSAHQQQEVLHLHHAVMGAVVRHY